MILPSSQHLLMMWEALFHRIRVDGRCIATSASDSYILVLTDNAHHLLHLSSSDSAFTLCFTFPRFCRRFVRFVFPCLLAVTLIVRRIVELEVGLCCTEWSYESVVRSRTFRNSLMSFDLLALRK